MTYHSFVRRFAVAVTLCLVAAAGSYASTVTADFVQKRAISDSDVFTTRLLKTSDDQMDLFVYSTSPQPQEFTLKIQGLKASDQDLYIDGKFVGKKTAAELTGGIKLAIPGRVVNPVLYRCAEAVKPRVDSEIKYVEQIQDDEHVRALYTLRQASGWVKSALQGDKNLRSVNVVLVTSGTPLKSTGGLSVKDPEVSSKVFVDICDALQRARDTMYDNITFGVLRNQVVVALTPVDLKLTYSVVNGKAKGSAVLINNCDLPISGKITPTVPAGWKLDAANLVFSSVASGQSYKVDFTLVPSKPGTAAPKNLKTEAAVKVAYNTYMAKFILTAEAAQGATVTVPLIRTPESAPASSSPAPAKAPVAAPAGIPVGESALE